MADKAVLRRDDISEFITNSYEGDLHAKRVLSLANATLGVLTSASLAVHAIGQGLAQAMGKLSKHGIKQVDRLLINEAIDVKTFFGYWVAYMVGAQPGLVLAQKSVLPRLEALAERWSVQAVRNLGCICWYLVRELHKRPDHARRRALSRHLLGAYGALQDRLGGASASLLEAVEAVLHQRHRASSAIEGFNAALRPYLYVHKRATQGFLDLFRAWFNLRTRRWGRHKGTSAHECLTRQRVHDWLTLLGYPPSPTLN